MGNIFIDYFDTGFGKFIIGAYDNKICLLDFVNAKDRDKIDNKIQKSLNAKFINFENKIIKKTKKQLNEYFNKQRKYFDIPYMLIDTDFQKEVRNEVSKIEYGKITTYKDIAINIGKEKAYRAAANAISKNYLIILIPCHRIIGSNNKLRGYRGGVEIKKKLLNLEGIDI